MENLLKDAQLLSAINYANWALGLALLIIYTLIFQVLFRKFALVASNRDVFASNFMFFAVAIYLIITTIKSSLALSLGLVGALSIIRFRTAIKEPEQIIFLLALTANGQVAFSVRDHGIGIAPKHQRHIGIDRSIFRWSREA
jgi:hypothetical protein